MKDVPNETTPSKDETDVGPFDHPWIEEMRQYEPIDDKMKEAEAWF